MDGMEEARKKGKAEHMVMVMRKRHDSKNDVDHRK